MFAGGGLTRALPTRRRRRSTGPGYTLAVVEVLLLLVFLALFRDPTPADVKIERPRALSNTTGPSLLPCRGHLGCAVGAPFRGRSMFSRVLRFLAVHPESNQILHLSPAMQKGNRC